MEALPKNHFRLPIEVTKADIDELNHVNNLVYLKWMIQAAVGHSKALGLGFEEFKKFGGLFVVRRHEIDYLRPAFLGDRLMLYTWSEPMESSRALRIYHLVREKDQKKMMEGKTFWAFVNPDTGRPTSIPDDLRAIYA
jgi:acyl-CoA thioester hydrolase